MSEDAESILITASNVTRRCVQSDTGLQALAPTTCVIRAKDRIAIMGASGSGKSTLLHLFAGLDSPTSGTLQWPGLGERQDLRPGKIAMAFQTPSLIPFLTVSENVALPVCLMGRNKSDAPDSAEAALSRLE